MRKWLQVFIVLTLIFAGQLHAQVTLDSLKAWSSVFLDVNKDEETKVYYNQKFEEGLKEFLENPESVKETFTLMNNISVLVSPDGNFKIFTWFTLHKDGYHKHGIVQAYGKKLKKPVVTILKDAAGDSKSVQYKTLNANNWLGALYYDLVPFKIKNKKYYLLLGFDGNNGVTHKKIADVIVIGNSGAPKFGANVFEKDKKTATRIILEYSAMAKISLKYDMNKKQIVFDHLAPQRPELADQYEFYVPDLSYDAFVFNKKAWVYKPDIDARNEGENGGSQGTRLVVDGLNDANTLDKKMEDK